MNDVALDQRRAAGTATFVLIVAVPLLVGLFASWLVYGVLPPTQSVPQLVVYWVVLSVVAVLAARGFQRLATRLMPMSMLLRLSMVLDDRRLDRALRDEDHDDPAVPPDLRVTAEALLHDLAHEAPDAAMHARRTAAIVDLMGEEIGLGPLDRVRLVWAARLYPVVDRRHESAATGLGPLTPWLGEYVVAIDERAERWDGTGAPEGLAREEIALGARILAVAAGYDLLVTGPDAMAAEDARRRMIDLAGTQFDPMVVRAFLALPAKRLRALVGPLTSATSMSGAGRALELLSGASAVAAPAAAVGVGVVLAALAASPMSITPEGPSAQAEAPLTVAQPPVVAADATPLPAPDKTPEATEVPEDVSPERTTPQPDPAPDVPEAEVLGVQIVRPDPPPVDAPPVAVEPVEPEPTVEESVAPVDVESVPPAAPEDDAPRPPARPRPDSPPATGPAPTPTPSPPSSPSEPPVTSPPPSSVPPGPPDPIPPGQSGGDEDGPLVIEVLVDDQHGRLDVTVVVTNVSDETITGIRAVANGVPGGPQHDLGSLAPGESTSMSVSRPGSGAVTVTITVSADGVAPTHVTLVVPASVLDDTAREPEPPLEPQPPSQGEPPPPGNSSDAPGRPESPGGDAPRGAPAAQARGGPGR